MDIDMCENRSKVYFTVQGINTFTWSMSNLTMKYTRVSQITVFILRRKQEPKITSAIGKICLRIGSWESAKLCRDAERTVTANE